jgi:hypothetical protein
MTNILDRSAASTSGDRTDPAEIPIPITRHRIDRILIGAGVLAVAVFAVAGGLLSWGNNFANDYVGDELAAQNVVFPDEVALTGQGREDLASYGGELVDTGKEAEAYASYIQGHVADIADGATYAGLSGPERAANAAVSEAVANGASSAEVAAFEAEAAAISGQRDAIFRGEMLRGALLNTFAWSTIGRIAGIAAIVAFVASALMAVLVIAGVGHLRRHRTAIS